MSTQGITAASLPICQLPKLSPISQFSFILSSLYLISALSTLFTEPNSINNLKNSIHTLTSQFSRHNPSPTHHFLRQALPKSCPVHSSKHSFLLSFCVSLCFSPCVRPCLPLKKNQKQANSIQLNPFKTKWFVHDICIIYWHRHQNRHLHQQPLQPKENAG